MNEYLLFWLHSAGGLFLLHPQATLGNWHGAQARHTSAQSHERLDSDYETVCSTTQHVDLLPRDGVEFLVLCDEARYCAWIPHGDGGVFVLWQAGNNEEQLLISVGKAFRDSDGWEKHFVWKTESGQFVLFDAAFQSECINPSNSFAISLLQNEFDVTTKAIQDDERDAWFVLVKLSAKSLGTPHDR